MIAVNVRSDGITIDGHAGYAKAGNDIICAAVSALAENLVNSIQALTDDKVGCEFWDGHMNIHYRDLSERGKLLVDSFFVGICAISGTYGEQYVQII